MKLLKPNIKGNTGKEQASLAHLKRFIRSLQFEDLKTFPRFCTGADVLCVDEIEIDFTDLTGIKRRVIAHTCGRPLTEVPYTYSNEDYGEFKEELLNVLKCGYWNMDIV